MDIYTDGSCLGNPGPGGFGVICIQDDKIIATYQGNSKHTTNNRMELKAAITALEKHKSRGNKIYTDSQYVKKGIEEANIFENFKRQLEREGELDERGNV